MCIRSIIDSSTLFFFRNCSLSGKKKENIWEENDEMKHAYKCQMSFSSSFIVSIEILTMIISKRKKGNDRALFNKKKTRMAASIKDEREREKVVNKGRELEGDNEKLEVRSITRRLYTSQTCLSSLNNSNILLRQSKKASGGRTKSLETEIMDGMKEKKCIVVIVASEQERERERKREREEK